MKEKREVIRRQQVDLCRLEELERLARRTECLAMDIACELNGSGHPEPPKLTERLMDDGAGSTSLDGSGHPEPPKLDAIVDIAYGARTIREGVNSLR